ncbi:hypothetical protein Pfo_019083 [Paulownia fortunei]|nr:hypothetical protein Pfo_019083 [Paulownia fortunei]
MTCNPEWKEIQEKLYHVAKYMMDEKCKYHYRRPYCERRIQDKDGYTIHRKRKNRLIVQVRNAQLNVPYNQYLLSRYNYHINIKICSGVIEVRYLYKYIYKGQDRLPIHINHNDDANLIGCHFVIDGLGETGKTFLYRILLAYLRSKNLITLATAISRGVATIMLWERTAHSYCKVPISYCVKHNYSCGMKHQSEMMAIETIDKLLKDVMEKNEDFLLKRDLVNSLTQNDLSAHKLVLKRNYPIILLRNLDPLNRLCNGKKMVRNDFKNKVIDTNIVFGQQNGEHHLYVAFSRITSISTTKVLIKPYAANVREKHGLKMLCINKF